MSDVKETRSFSINDILSWKDNGELILSPKYQRNKVWNINAKSYLIDTILRGYPIPQIFIRQTIDISTRKTIREVIDGQQRITAIIEYYNNYFQVKKTHNNEFGDMNYKDLSETDKEFFLDYNICFEVIKLKDDSKIYEMFARLNTNNIALNKQELRNAKYWGEFKVFVLRKASEYKNIFIEKKIFKDKDLSRMADVDFMNSLVINLIDGVTTDSNTKIETYYKKYEAEFEMQNIVEEKLNTILNRIESIFFHPQYNTRIFKRKNYFWTLFAILHHELYGLDDDMPRNQLFNIANFDENLFISKISLLEGEVLEAETDPDNAPSEMRSFISLHKTRTTNKIERLRRLKIFADYLMR